MIPTLQEFIKTRHPGSTIFQHFMVPKFLHGDVTPEGLGVLVLEDISARGFKTFDVNLIMLDYDHLRWVFKKSFYYFVVDNFLVKLPFSSMNNFVLL